MVLVVSSDAYLQQKKGALVHFYIIFTQPQPPGTKVLTHVKHLEAKKIRFFKMENEGHFAPHR